LEINKPSFGLILVKKAYFSLFFGISLHMRRFLRKIEIRGKIGISWLERASG